MPSSEDINNQWEILNSYRHNLQHLLRQAASAGGPHCASIEITNDIAETRKNIFKCKSILRLWDQEVEDLPDEDDPERPSENPYAGLSLPMRQALAERADREQKRIQALMGGLADVLWPAGLLIHAFQAVSGRPSPLAPDSVELLAMLAQELALNTLLSQRDPLAEFVGLLRRGCGERRSPVHKYKEVQKHLKGWLSTQAPTAVLPLETVQRFDTLRQTVPALLIAVRDCDNRAYNIETWILYPDGWVDVLEPPSSIGGLQLQIEQIRASLPALHRESIRKIERHTDQLRVEFFLPLSLLREAVQEWEVTSGVQSKPRALGSEHAVVVRSYERCFASELSVERGRWRSKWHHLVKLAAHHNAIIRLADSSEYTDLDDLLDRLRDPQILCYVESIKPPPDRDEDVLAVLLDAGLPVALWLCQANDCSGEVIQALEELVRDTDLRELPQRMLAALRRRRRRLRPHIALFHDNPERMPYDPDDPHWRYKPLAGGSTP